jgi:hypothetical protein
LKAGFRKFENTKAVVRSRESNDMQYNVNRKRVNNDLQNTTQNTKAVVRRRESNDMQYNVKRKRTNSDLQNTTQNTKDK